MRIKSILLVLITALSSPAAVISWTNTANGNWNTATCWNPNTVPGASDTAVITNAGTYTVTLNASATLAGLQLGGASGTQTLAQSANILTLNGPGVIAPNGRCNWSGGTLAGTAALVVTPGGQLNLSSSTIKTLSGSVTNGGTVTWSGTGSFALGAAGVLHNLAAGLMEIQNDEILDYGSGSPVFVNDGTIRKSAGTAQTQIQVPFVNNGTVDVQTATIRFDTQDKTFNAGSRFTGAGTNLLYNGSIALNGIIHSENLLLGGAALTGTGSLSGTMFWTSGSIAADGKLTVATDGGLQLSGTVHKYVYGTLTNAGQIVWAGAGDIYLYGLIHNQSGGVFEARNDEILQWASGTPVFINDGVVRKLQSTGLTQIQVAFINNGTVDAQTGTIRFDTQGKSFNAGCQFTGAGTSLLYGGNVTLNGAIYSENLQLGGAALTGEGALSGTMSWTSGNIAADGKLTVASDGVLQLSGTTGKNLYGALTNAGQVVWAGTGDIALLGLIHNQPGGVFEARNDAILNWVSGTPVFVNDGVFRKAQSTGLTQIQVAFINNGTVAAQTGTIRFDTQGKTFNAGCQFIGAGTSLLYSGTINLSGSIHSENLLLGGATLSGAGSVNGSFTWNSGTLSPDVSFNVTTNGHLTLASSSAKVINGSITNAGVVTWTGLGNLQVRGAIHNLPGGLFEIQNNEYLDWISGSPVFVNDGTIRKTISTGVTICQIAFVNNGTVDVQTGTIRFDTQPKTLNAGCRFTGAGVSSLYSGVAVTLAGAIESENLALNGAIVSGAGSVNGSFTWNSGTLTPDVSFNITTNGLLLLASSGSKVLNGTITNAGVVRWTGSGNLTVRGVIHILPGGLLDAQNNEVLDFVSGTPVIVNEGVFRKSAGTLTTTCQIPFSNLGRVEVSTGTLSFTGTFTDQAGSIALGGGTFQTAQPLTMTGGVFSGQGTLKPGSGVAAALTSAATVAPATNGTLTIQGDYTQLLSGSAQFTLGGTNASTNHSQLVISGDATLRGCLTVSWETNFTANLGDAFKVMKFASVRGDFDCFNGLLLLGRDLRLVEQYTPTNLTLVTTAAPDPTNVVAHVGVQPPAAIVCWPTEFSGYGLYWNTNLATTNWVFCPGATNYYVDPNMVPQKFFKIMK